MKPLIHALSSAKKHGGSFEAFLPVHELMDSSKAVLADNRHRALLHNSWGASAAVRAFGPSVASASTIAIAEQHCLEDIRFVPSLQDWHSHVDQDRVRMRTRGNAARDADGGVARVIDEAILAYQTRNRGRSLDEAAAAAMIRPILEFLDEGRLMADGDPQHSLAIATLNSFTIFLAERIFGSFLRLPGDKIPIATRELAERLAILRWKKIPSPVHFLQGLALAPWMSAGCATCPCACPHAGHTRRH